MLNHYPHTPMIHLVKISRPSISPSSGTRNWVRGGSRTMISLMRLLALLFIGVSKGTGWSNKQLESTEYYYMPVRAYSLASNTLSISIILTCFILFEILSTFISFQKYF